MSVRKDIVVLEGGTTLVLLRDLPACNHGTFIYPDEGPMHENDGSVVYVFWGLVGLVLGLVGLFLNTHREQLSTSPHLSCMAKALSNIMTDL